MTCQQPPRLPARPASLRHPPTGDGIPESHEQTPARLVDLAVQSPNPGVKLAPTSPPRLPPRNQPQSNGLPALSTITSPSSIEAGTPLPVVSVAITPATPPLGTSPIAGQFDAPLLQVGETENASLFGTARETNRDRAADSLLTEQVQTAPLPGQFKAEDDPIPPSLPPRRPSSPQVLSKLDNAIEHTQAGSLSAGTSSGPTLQWLILIVLLLNLLQSRISLSWLVVALGLLAVLQRQNPRLAQTRNGARKVEDGYHRSQGDRASVDWVNHTLHALFPLISTDVLTPFIDLLEDALAQQVPAIITSVRLTSASLGSQPLLLTSLRPMSDEEWFSSLSKGEKLKATATAESKGHHRATSSTPMMPPLSARSTTSGGGNPHSPNSPNSKLRRSVSASSKASVMEEEDLRQEAQRLRNRDRVLQTISRRGGMGSPARYSGEENLSHRRPVNGDVERDVTVHQTGDKPEAEAVKQNEERIRGSPGKVTLDEDDPIAGQYVNYRIGFEYARPESKKRKGWGLHVLAYFGWGVKGVGKSEIPVYIDVLSIKGTVDVRLLLSATPPFVRTGTFSLPSLPEFDISAQPLKKASFNAMELPGMKSYVQASISEVAKAFVRPESYSLDLDRLLLGREASLRTATVGVLHVILHGASELPKADAVGSCDPYATISFSKFKKPRFSTRTIIDTQKPSWEETAFILVAADAIAVGEGMTIQVCDSDRFSADDALGVVEVDLADLLDQSRSSSATSGLQRRKDKLGADRPGMRVSGTLDWSVRFYPLWQMSLEEMTHRLGKIRAARKEPEFIQPWWMQLIGQFVEDKPDWEVDQAERRKETLAWFTGEKERDEMEAAAKPSEDLRSGVLQFHIHQCNDLEFESLGGTYSSVSNHGRSAAGGKPALADIVDRTPAENPDPPSAYCEVHINDGMVYRTRTKQITPHPYFNAVSERFIRDWHLAKVVFVVRDDRDREHDPILGLISIPLLEAFADRSHFTRWFPLVGGLGWGRIRLSLLWKPIDIQLPPRISGFEVATLEIRSLSASDIASHAERSVSVVIETETDHFTISPSTDGDYNQSRITLAHGHAPSLAESSPQVMGEDEATEIEWEITRPIRLAVEYRHSCSVLISFVTHKKSVLKKKRVLGIASIRLDDCPDSEEITKLVPIFATDHVTEAVNASQTYNALSQSTSSPANHRGVRPLGFVSISFVVHPGISRAHQKLCKRDLRFRHVFEAWEAAREADVGWDKTSSGDILRRKKLDAHVGHEEHGQESDESDTTDDDQDDVKHGLRTGKYDLDGVKGSPSGRSTITLDDDEEEGKGFMVDRKAHSHALHKRNKGIFQLKIARTGKFVKDKLQAKFHERDQSMRTRGTDQDVEYEGQSSL